MRYLMLVKVAGKGTETVVNAVIKNARRLPKQLYLTFRVIGSSMSNRQLRPRPTRQPPA